MLLKLWLRLELPQVQGLLGMLHHHVLLLGLKQGLVLDLMLNPALILPGDEKDVGVDGSGAVYLVGI